MPIWWIYGLYDPDKPEEIRYVGKTEKGLSSRLGEHIRDATRYGRAPHVPRNRWIKKIFAQGRLPILRQLDTGLGIHPYDWIVSEQCWIAYYRFMGHGLLNVTAGGEGSIGQKHSAEVRAKMSLTRTGKKRPPGTGERISAGQKASTRWTSKEFQDWLVTNTIRLRTFLLTPEARAKNSLAKTGCKASPEARAKMSATRKGRINPLPVGAPPINDYCPGKKCLPKLTDAQVMEIRRRYASEKIPMHRLALEFGVTTTIVHRLLIGKTYSRVTGLKGFAVP